MNELTDNYFNPNEINIVHGTTKTEYKFFEYLNKNYNYSQKKEVLDKFQVHLGKDEVRFTEKVNNLKETSIARNLKT